MRVAQKRHWLNSLSTASSFLSFNQEHCILMLISGKYCVYKKGVCPLGLSEGFLHWDDEDRNNVNKDGGSLPEGAYGSDTRIFFCCRTDGDKSDPVPLPLSKPFYLLAYGSSDCQLVKGAITTTEYIIFDNEDRNNQDSSGGVHPYASSSLVYYCYYQGKLVCLFSLQWLWCCLLCFSIVRPNGKVRNAHSDLLARKRMQLICYSSQMREHPWTHQRQLVWVVVFWIHYE